MASESDHGLPAVEVLESPLGPLFLAASDQGLMRVAFEDEDWNAITSGLSDHLRGTDEASIEGLRQVARSRVDLARRQLTEYFSLERKQFDLPLDLRQVHGFRRSVAEHLMTIPFGSTETYSEVANALDNPRAVRAVGSACSHNQIPIVIPCHRVLRSDGHIGGYLGGTSAKEFLLEMEGVIESSREDSG